MLNHTAYRFYRLVSSGRHWAARRLTRAGWLLLCGIVLTAGMATDTEQSLGYQAFAFLICLGLVAVLTARWFAGRFAAERFLPRFGTAGQPLHYRVTVRNLTPRLQRDLTLFDDLADPRPTFAEFVTATKTTRRRKSFRASEPMPSVRRVMLKTQALPPIPAGDESEIALELLPLKRGVLHFAGVSVARTDPFGLFRAFSRVALPGAITILPKRYALPQIMLPGAARYQQGGVAFASAIGESEEFVSLRDYRPGDPLRHVHWRSWAKAGRPIVKEFQDEFFVRHALILDTFTEPDEVELFEAAVSVAASFACTIDTQESLLDLLFVGPHAFCFTIGRGVAHADQMLEILASVNVCPDQAFASLEQIVIEHASEVSGAICIFLAWDEARQQLVRKLKAMGVPLLILVLREPDSPPLEAGAMNDTLDALHALEVGNIERDLSRL